MNKTYYIGMIIVLVAVIGVGFLATQEESPASAVTGENPTSTVTDTSPSDPETTTSAESSDQPDSGLYTEYDPELVTNSTAKHIVLTFSANWCPTCRALDADIIAHADAIPADVEIYKVNFDTETELRQQYGVTIQHTLVVIEPDGTKLNSWNGGTTLQSIVDRL